MSVTCHRIERKSWGLFSVVRVVECSGGRERVVKRGLVWGRGV